MHGLVVGQSRRNRPLIHVNAAVEAGAFRDDHVVGAETASDRSRRAELDSRRCGDRPVDVAEHDHLCAAKVGFDAGAGRDDDCVLAHDHAAVDPAMDSDVFVAGDVADDVNRWTDVCHVVWWKLRV